MILIFVKSKKEMEVFYEINYARYRKCFSNKVFIIPVFVFENQNQYFLVDGGGGNTLLSQLEKAHINWQDIKDIFVTHKHIDHLMGIIWMIRMIGQHMSQGKYQGEVRIYAHKELIDIIMQMVHLVLEAKHTQFINKRIHLIEIQDHDSHMIINHQVTFFDIHSTKNKTIWFFKCN